MRGMRMMAGALVLLGMSALAVAAAETKEDLQKRFEERLPEIQTYKDASTIGETGLGYLEAVKDEHLTDEKLKKLVEDENTDRKQLYEIIAKEKSTAEKPVTTEDVGKHNAILKFQKAAESEYFKGKDGTWRTKKQMLEEAEKKSEGA